MCGELGMCITTALWTIGAFPWAFYLCFLNPRPPDLVQNSNSFKTSSIVPSFVMSQPSGEESSNARYSFFAAMGVASRYGLHWTMAATAAPRTLEKCLPSFLERIEHGSFTSNSLFHGDCHTRWTEKLFRLAAGCFITSHHDGRDAIVAGDGRTLRNSPDSTPWYQ